MHIIIYHTLAAIAISNAHAYQHLIITHCLPTLKTPRTVNINKYHPLTTLAVNRNQSQAVCWRSAKGLNSATQYRRCHGAGSYSQAAEHDFLISLIRCDEVPYNHSEHTALRATPDGNTSVVGFG